MADPVCLVSYHEIGLKGKNRRLFEDALLLNLRTALDGLSLKHLGRLQGRVLATFEDPADTRLAPAIIRQVPGVARVMVAWRCARSEEALCASAIAALSEAGPFETFKVHAKKSNTDFAMHTLDMNRVVGAALCEAFPDKKVLMKAPGVTVHVNIVGGDGYVFCDGVRGVGGLPVGTAGKVVSLLSSGFDSPVATWMVGRRGACVCPLHFSGRPVTSDDGEWLVRDILEALRPAGLAGRPYVVPFGEVQRQVALDAPPALRVILYRRFMFRVAERLARIEGAKALVTGESLGQVASQTLDNIQAVDDVVEELPVLRPLIGSDKVEIIERAQELGTFDLSSQQATDCCTLFMPRRPETHARLAAVRAAWEALRPEPLVQGLLDSIEYIDLEGCPSYRPPRSLSERHSDLSPAKVV